MPKQYTWKKAIEIVLNDAGEAMHYRDIATQIIDQGLRLNVGATPAATVSANITSSIKHKGDESPFQKVASGEYMLRTRQVKPNAFEPLKLKAGKPDKEVNTDESQYEIITSFGMFWRRDYVDWTASAKLLGMQQLGAEPVNFNNQLGVYLLYDGREVIYVGRSTERPLGLRLYEHTRDRLATRWDRFSWFGLLPVSDTGALQQLPEHYLAAKMIPAMEAVLIEALEPRQNRRRGDDLAAVEYVQQEDPEIKKKQRHEILLEALAKS